VLSYLVHDLRVPASLDIVGKRDHRLVGYARMLELIAREYEIESHVNFAGEIAGDALAERYFDASVFVSASDHEGFCVPLVEAMAFGVPIVALGTTAVPETIGDAGLIWAERDPRRFAVAIRHLVGSTADRAELAGKGRSRFAARFANGVLEKRLAEILAPGTTPFKRG
jgi:glycosyltransferase involved in cell wall biosynthesis